MNSSIFFPFSLQCFTDITLTIGIYTPSFLSILQSLPQPNRFFSQCADFFGGGHLSSLSNLSLISQSRARDFLSSSSSNPNGCNSRIQIPKPVNLNPIIALI